MSAIRRAKIIPGNEVILIDLSIQTRLDPGDHIVMNHNGETLLLTPSATIYPNDFEITLRRLPVIHASVLPTAAGFALTTDPNPCVDEDLAVAGLS